MKEKEEKVDRRRDGQTVLKNVLEWTLPAQLGQLKTGQDGKDCCRYLWWPDELARLWDSKV